MAAIKLLYKFDDADNRFLDSSTYGNTASSVGGIGYSDDWEGADAVKRSALLEGNWGARKAFSSVEPSDFGPGSEWNNHNTLRIDFKYRKVIATDPNGFNMRLKTEFTTNLKFDMEHEDDGGGYTNHIYYFEKPGGGDYLANASGSDIPDTNWHTVKWLMWFNGTQWSILVYIDASLKASINYEVTSELYTYNPLDSNYCYFEGYNCNIDDLTFTVLAAGEVDPPVDPGLEETISDLIYLPDYYTWRFTVKDGEVTSEYSNNILDAFRTGESISYDPFANYAYKTVEDIIRIRSLLDNSRARDSGGVINTEYEDTISDFLVNVDDLLQTPNLFMGFTDEIALEDLVTPNGTFSESLSEIVLFIPVKDEPSVCFNTYSFNSRINAVSEYTNYNFNSYAVYQTRAYGASSEGFYLLEGCTDNEDPIVVKLRTAAMDFGTSNLKSIPQVYLGIAQDSSIIMKVAVDGKAETYHKLDLATNHLGTQRIKLPKGHIGRWFQFELESETVSEFNLDSIEFYLMPFRRKI
jgi:hypothetical protein